MTCYKSGGCGVYENRSCSECPASKPEYLKRNMEEYIKKSDVLEMLSLPSDILKEYIYELKGVWVDEDWSDKRIEKALRIAWRFGQIDGAHHKMWVIDQMVRALCDNKKEYNEWVEAYQTPDGEDYYEWDTGIAP